MNLIHRLRKAIKMYLPGRDGDVWQDVRMLGGELLPLFHRVVLMDAGEALQLKKYEKQIFYEKSN
jgi:hypothetical protein